MLQKIRRCVFLILGVIGLVWFMLPYMTYKILMLGNETGAAISIILIIAAIFQEQIDNALAKLWKSKIGKAICGISAGIIAAVVILVVIMTSLMIHSALKKPVKDSVLVVLGCQVSGENPSLMLEERLEAAYNYMTDNTDTVAVLSGGQGPGENISEAECMFRYLTNRGIPEYRLYREDKSTSTKENIAYTYNILKENNLGNDIVIVTNEFHQYRASIIAKHSGLEVSAVSGKTNIMLFPSFYVRELYGILYEWIL